jgi:hypothetical protein
LWNRLTCLLKRFRFSENEKEVNNKLKHIFCCFMFTVQKLEMFQSDSPLKRFNFFPFKAALIDSSLNLKHFTLSTGILKKGVQFIGSWILMAS